MICLTGDTHGEFERIEDFCMEYETGHDDVLIILGDVGINYFGDPDDRESKERLAQLPITLLCIHGNHEMRPESLDSYEVAERFGGLVYWEPEFPNLLFAMDGEIYELAGNHCLVVGGAYSVDKYYRLNGGGNWWEDEQPSDEIKDRVEERLDIEGWSVDVVLSHTCPFKYIPREAFLPNLDQSMVDNSTEHWLDSIEDKLKYARWYCGHYHIDKSIDNMKFLFESFDELYGK